MLELLLASEQLPAGPREDSQAGHMEKESPPPPKKKRVA